MKIFYKIYPWLLIIIGCLPFFGYVPSTMFPTAIIYPDAFLNLVFRPYDPFLYGINISDNTSFYITALIFKFLDLLSIPVICRAFCWYLINFSLIYFFASCLIKRYCFLTKNSVSDNLVKILSLFVLYNFYTIVGLDNGMSIVSYLGVVVAIYASLYYCTEQSSKAVLIVIVAFNIATAQITFAIITVISSTFLVYSYIGAKGAIRFLTLVILSTIWYWGAIFITVLHPTTTQIYSLGNESFKFYSSTLYLSDIVRFMGNWVTSHNAVPIASLLNSKVYIMVSFIPFLIVLKTLSNPYNTDYKKLLYAYFILLILASGSNITSPISPIVNYIDNNILALRVFRNTYKFVPFLVIITALMMVNARITKLNELILVYVGVILIGLLFVKIVPDAARIKEIPEYWIKTEQIYSKSMKNQNILLAPFTNNSIYNWGAYNGFEHGIPVQIEGKFLFRSLASPNNQLIEHINESIVDPKDYIKFCDKLQELNIKYVINRLDIISEAHFDFDGAKCLKSDHIGNLVVHEVVN